MRRVNFRWAALALVVSVSAQAQTGTPPPTRSTSTSSGPSTTAKSSLLEETLEVALKYNPDLRVALAKLQEAEAEVARARLQVARKVVGAYRAAEGAREMTKPAEARLQELLRVMGPNSANSEILQKARKELEQAKAYQAAAEAELDYLVGKAKLRVDTSPSMKPPSSLQFQQQRLYADSMNTAFGAWARRVGEPLRGASADRIRKALDRRTSFKFGDTPAREVLEKIRKEIGDIHIQAATASSAWDEKVTAALTDVPLGAVLQLLQDVLPGHRVLVREYGLFIVPQDKSPPGAVNLGEFWHHAASEATPKTQPGPRR